MVRAQRQTSMSARSDFRLRRCHLGRRQVFASQHAVCYVLCCNGAAFSWKSALAPILALSTSEAELISVASCAQEVNFCRKLATELGFIQPGPTPIAEDNTGAIALLEHGHFKGRSKHVQTPSRDQLADIGTKACPAPQLKFQRSLLHGGLSLDRRLAKSLVFTAALPP